MPDIKRGKFIAFVGPDGVGKSTQVEKAQEYIRSQGVEVMYLKEPGTTSVGKLIESTVKDPSVELGFESELFLFLAARAQAVDRIIRPALKRGAIVVGDRFDLCTEAYQGAGRFHNDESIMRVIQLANALAVRDARPDVELYLTAPSALREVRLRASGKLDRMESAGSAFFERVAAHYQRIAELPREYHGRNIVNIDASPCADNVFTSSVKPVLENLIASLR